jgi:hypothetical protein
MRIIVLCALGLVLPSTPFAADKNLHETCFLAVLFAQGGTVAVTLENEGKHAEDVTVQRYSADGTLLDAVARSVAAKTKTDVRLDVSSARPEFGWIRVVTKGDKTVVSSTYETLSGNSLTTIPHLAVFRHPLSENAVREARRYSIRHRYTYDVFALHGVAYFFVNLSDYPVEVGMCQADYPDCTNLTLPHTVPPRASISFRIDQQKRFLVLESTPGYSAATALEWGEGLTKIFGATTTITFDPVR